MKRIHELPGFRKLHRQIRELHARGLLIPLVLVLAIVGVLIDGLLRREPPGSAANQSEPTPPAIELPTLRPDLEKTPLAYQSDYWRQLGQEVRNKIVLIGRRNIPGIVVAPGVLLTSIIAADDFLAEQREQQVMSKQAEEEETTGAETEIAESHVPYNLLGVDSEMELAVFAIKQDDPDASFQLREYSVLPPGSHLAAVSLAPDMGLMIAPGFSTSLSSGMLGSPVDDQLEVSIPFPESMQVAVIVDLDAELVGVAYRSSKGMQVISSQAVWLIVDSLAEGTACQAIEAAEISDQARKLLGVTRGVVVEKVRQDAFLPEPSIREGDILISWNRHPIDGVEEFSKLYLETEPGALVRYTVIRNRRRISGGTRMPGPDCRPVAEPLYYYASLGVTVLWEQGWKVAGVVEDSPTARSGLEENDIIVGINGRELDSRNRAAFERFERNPSPLALSVRRDDRVKLLTVTPVSESEEAEPSSESSSPDT